MIVKVVAAEDLNMGMWVAILLADDGKLYCKTANKRPHAMTARRIRSGEVLNFNTAANTGDLLRNFGNAGLA